jgi:peptidoglycan hydrolase CwlO-like protein
MSYWHRGPLQQVLAAPERFALARKQLDDLTAQRKALTAEAQTVDGQLTKIAKQLADLEARIAVETKSASRTLLDTEAEFVVPETLTKLEVEQRITRASQAELERQRDVIQTQLAGLPDAVRKARDHFIHCRAAMTEIELYEQLMPVMNAMARASAARRQINHHHDESRFPVEIPRALIEAAGDALAAEMPAA